MNILETLNGMHVKILLPNSSPIKFRITSGMSRHTEKGPYSFSVCGSLNAHLHRHAFLTEEPQGL